MPACGGRTFAKSEHPDAILIAGDIYDVNEYDVAQHFHIPHMQVKKWIREGRIEYKDDHLNTITMHCTRCGAPIAFGTLCAKCMRQKDVSIHSSAREDISDSRMRFIED